jgi:hypothetical protein
MPVMQEPIDIPEDLFQRRQTGGASSLDQHLLSQLIQRLQTRIAQYEYVWFRLHQTTREILTDFPPHTPPHQIQRMERWVSLLPGSPDPYPSHHPPSTTLRSRRLRRSTIPTQSLPNTPSPEKTSTGPRQPRRRP